MNIADLHAPVVSSVNLPAGEFDVLEVSKNLTLPVAPIISTQLLESGLLTSRPDVRWEHVPDPLEAQLQDLGLRSPQAGARRKKIKVCLCPSSD